MKRLRVAIVIPGFPVRRYEPGLAAVVDLIERIAIEHEVEVLALRHPPVAEPYEMAGARVTPLQFGRAGGPIGRARVLWAGVTTLLNKHRTKPFDIVHAVWADEPGVIGAVGARLVRRPVIVSVMGGELAALADIGYGAALGRGGRWTVRASLPLANLVTVPSAYLRTQVIERRPGTPITVMPLGVDTSAFRPTDGPTARPTVLFVGSLEPVKDPGLALRTFAAMMAGRDNLRLVIAGSGSLREDLEEQARQLRIAEVVEFVGQVPRSAMPDLYRSASVMLVTSRHESQSMAAVEAAASGVPIVGMRVGVLPELGGGALTVSQRDEVGLATQLGRVLDDRELADAMGAQGRTIATSRYDIAVAATAFLSAYERLVARHRGASPP